MDDELLVAVNKAHQELALTYPRVRPQLIADHIGVTLDTSKGRRVVRERLKQITANYNHGGKS